MRRWSERVDGPAVGIFAAALVVYLLTLAPTVLAADSAEFQAVAYTWGVPHPTGYPVYVFASKPFTWLPIGNVAWRVNFMSAVCGAGAGVVLFRILARLGASKGPAALGALTLVLGETFWSQAVRAEVHMLSSFLLLLVLLQAVHLAERPTRGRIWLFGFSSALVAGTHGVVAILLPLVVLLFLRPAHLRRHPWTYAGAALGSVLAAALFYAHIPLNAGGHGVPVSGLLQKPVLDWTWGYVTARPYDSVMWSYGWSEQPARLLEAVTLLGRDLGWIGLAVVPFGLARLERRQRWTLAAMVAVNVVFAMNSSAVDASLYFMPAHVLLALFLGLGAHELAIRLPEARRRLATTALALLPAALLVVNFPKNDLSDERSFDRWGRDFLTHADERAYVFAPWKYYCTLHYLQAVEGLRPDLALRNNHRPDEADVRRHAVKAPVLRVRGNGEWSRLTPETPR